MSISILPHGVIPTPSGRNDGNIRDAVEAAKGDQQNNAATGASAAGVRALTARMAAFYFRAPVRSFFKTRVDYLAYPKALTLLASPNPTSTKWSPTQTTPFILYRATKAQGLSFLPLTVLPPLLANVSISTILYTSYLTALSTYHPSSLPAQKRVYPPPPISATFLAGATAGTIQTVFAAPFDALVVRFKTTDLLERRYRSMWSYASHTLRRIGWRGAYAGSSLSLAKDSLGAGLFFSTFEAIKSQCFYAFVRRWYGLQSLSAAQRGEVAAEAEQGRRGVVRPHYLMEPAFLTLAGAGASVVQSTVVHPLSMVQQVHWGRYEGLDRQFVAERGSGIGGTRERYMEAYRKTGKVCAVLARREGGWVRWLYKDFWWGTIRQKEVCNWWRGRED
ncbi:putative mitochondrial carrier protein 17 [Elsinoe fawcettii]|nr:putative mitochondrial carrier protein 17 [Elsinoe fawcettii]